MKKSKGKKGGGQEEVLSRRGFLGGILAAGFAPAFIGSQVLMPVKAPARLGWAPEEVSSFDDMIRDIEDAARILDAAPVPATGRTITAAGLSRGDVFTIFGDPKHYRVTHVVGNTAHIAQW